MINELVKEAHETAVEKGWWRDDRSNLECIVLMHCELSEAVESLRKGDDTHAVEELADVLIRVFDLCGRRGWDLARAVTDKMAYNKTRSYRHGNKLA
jgi:NTP pyrophosphatase (non-canonical NTP hydrolase)